MVGGIEPYAILPKVLTVAKLEAGLASLCRGVVYSYAPMYYDIDDTN